MIARQPLIAGNWKMNGSSAFVDEFMRGLTGHDLPVSVVVVLFPPIAYLQSALRALRGCSVQLGAQNAHSEAAGPYTGEIAAEMVSDLGAQWLLVGHSERRRHFGETDEVIAGKFAAAVRADLNPILCVGETLEQRQAGQAEMVVCAQVREVVDRVGAQVFARGTLAYEPVWAIGTGHTPLPDQVQAMHAAIRGEIGGVNIGLAEQMRVLYGGSMNADNAEILLAERDVDGGLIGGASLQADDFASIVRTAAAITVAEETT